MKLLEIIGWYIEVVSIMGINAKKKKSSISKYAPLSVKISQKLQ